MLLTVPKDVPVELNPPNDNPVLVAVEPNENPDVAVDVVAAPNCVVVAGTVAPNPRVGIFVVAGVAVKLNPDSVPLVEVLVGALKFNVGAAEAVVGFRLNPPSVLVAAVDPNVAPKAGGFPAKISY